MATRLQRNDNGVYTKDYYIIGLPIQTIGNEVKIVASIPTVINKGYKVTLRFAASDNSSVVDSFAGDITGFYRRLLGDITQIGSEIRDTATGFSGQPPNIKTQANIIDQTIDIVITGKTGETLDWIIEFTVDYRS